MANAIKAGFFEEADKKIQDDELQDKLHRKFKDVPQDTKIVLRSPNKARVEVLGRLWPLVLILLVLTLALCIYGFVVPDTRELLYIRPWNELMEFLNNSFGWSIPKIEKK